MTQPKRKRAPGAGHPRGATLPRGVPLVQLSPVKVTKEMLDFVKSQKEPLSDFIRAMILEKMQHERNGKASE